MAGPGSEGLTLHPEMKDLTFWVNNLSVLTNELAEHFTTFSIGLLCWFFRHLLHLNHRRWESAHPPHRFLDGNQKGGADALGG